MAEALIMAHSPMRPPSPQSSPKKPMHHISESHILEASSSDIIPIPPNLAPPDTPTRSPFTSSSTSSSGGAGQGRSREVSDSSIGSPPPLQGSEGVKGTRKTQLEDFELIRVLGKGCAGRVLLVKHTPTTRVLAMKAISKRSVLTHNELTHTLTELEVLRSFAIAEPDNRFIAKLHTSFTDRENFYLVMDFYPGGDLATQMEIHGILGHHRTRFYAADIVQGLEDLHRYGIVVRDLKPENILLNAKGHAVLADFGLSKSFGYRGDPKALHVVTYPGHPPLPEWAGAGMASSRRLPNGQTKLKMDTAHSFVGTSEYLSPEVVKRGEYTYAVDWWALGCIVLEGLIGRVPFRKDEEEAPIILWNRILHDPWDDVFRTPSLAKRHPTDYGLDEPTWHFIDALLQKDPMWRLTEPHVKLHPYFSFIDWDTIASGDYEDPHGLHLHAVAEYNTRYFPKLCLEEDPSVDMTDHEMNYDEGLKKTALNDNSIYKLEQAKWRKELDGFYWCDEEFEGGVEEGAGLGGMDVQEEEEGLREPGGEENGLDMEGETGDVVTESSDGVREDDENSLEGDVSDSGEEQESPIEPEIVISQELANMVLAQMVEVPVLRVDTGEVSDLRASPTLDSPSLPEIPLVSATSQVPDHPIIEEDSTRNADRSDLATPYRYGDVSDHSSPPTIPSILERPSIESSISSQMPPQAESHRTLNSPPTAPPSPSGTAPVPIMRSPPKGTRHLPSGLPASGLSVSDIVSIPSPGLDAPNRLVRRHPNLPSIDFAPIPRLSIERNGTTTHLEDEDWEELDLDVDNLQSIPNGTSGALPPSSFFNRVLRKRPSTLAMSGLRRQARSSDSSLDNTSPVRSKPALVNSFAGRGTKKALEKIKAFPRLRKVTGSASMPNAVVPLSISGSSSGSGSGSGSASGVSASVSGSSSMVVQNRNEEAAGKRVGEGNGWLFAKGRSVSGLGNGRMHGTGLGMGIGGMGRAVSTGGKKRAGSDDSMGSGVAPRVELRETPPVVWEI